MKRRLIVVPIVRRTAADIASYDLNEAARDTRQRVGIFVTP